MCQNRIIHREELPITFWTRFLSRFASSQNRGGDGVGMPIHVSGLFYKIVGREVSGLDEFYDGSWGYYKDIDIEIPKDSQKVCDEIYQILGISCMIVDANDFGHVILGKSSDANQFCELIPLVLIREKV